MKLKILIVEDEVLVAEDLAGFFEESGFHVCGIAISAEECFALMEKETPDIVILDIFLKGSTDGIGIARRINQTTCIPFIFLTANSDTTTIEKALQENPGAYMSKPFHKRDVKIAVELACRRHNALTLQSAMGSKELLKHFLFVKDANMYKRINILEILYVEAKGSYSKIVTKDRSYTLSYNLNYFSKYIDNSLFRKVHRSFVVNLSKVDGFDVSSLKVEGVSIPVSKQYHKDLLELFNRI